MQLKNIVSRAISILGLENEISVETPSAGLTKLVDCANMILQELTLQYVHLRTKEEVPFTGGRAYYSDFDHGVREILEVRENGNKVHFLPSNMYLEACVSGDSAEVTYVYYLEDLALNDTVYLPPKFTEYILAIGVACEYYYRMGLVDEAKFYKSRYDIAMGNLSTTFRQLQINRGRRSL